MQSRSWCLSFWLFNMTCVNSTKLYLKQATEFFFLSPRSMLFHSIIVLTVKVCPPSVFLLCLGHIHQYMSIAFHCDGCQNSLLIHPFDNYVTHTFWSWSLALISKLRNVIGSRFMRARLPGQMT